MANMYDIAFDFPIQLKDGSFDMLRFEIPIFIFLIWEFLVAQQVHELLFYFSLLIVVFDMVLFDIVAQKLSFWYGSF